MICSHGRTLRADWPWSVAVMILVGFRSTKQCSFTIAFPSPLFFLPSSSSSPPGCRRRSICWSWNLWWVFLPRSCYSSFQECVMGLLLCCLGVQRIFCEKVAPAWYSGISSLSVDACTCCSLWILFLFSVPCCYWLPMFWHDSFPWLSSFVSVLQLRRASLPLGKCGFRTRAQDLL